MVGVDKVSTLNISNVRGGGEIPIAPPTLGRHHPRCLMCVCESILEADGVFLLPVPRLPHLHLLWGAREYKIGMEKSLRSTSSTKRQT